MIIETVKRLMDSDISATKIEKVTGVDASSIRRIRRGVRKVENLSFEKGVKLYDYVNRPFNVEVQFDELNAGTDLTVVLEVQKIYEDGATLTIEELVNETLGQDEDEVEFIKKRLKELGHKKFIEITIV
ncbi:hypothetical protein LHJ68_13240 [Staphylococcus xylosus]|uniref:hypothetical protein n=1 Tax=Staphylococcus xylosus TaxID=1288 RepID=UPI001F32A091|nr:hypothetical protein [Staphylococcus xylosus]MCE7786969.1 hypothetical protein [Staphylococcus xylosus]